MQISRVWSGLFELGTRFLYPSLLFFLHLLLLLLLILVSLSFCLILLLFVPFYFPFSLYVCVCARARARSSVLILKEWNNSFFISRLFFFWVCMCVFSKRLKATESPELNRLIRSKWIIKKKSVSGWMGDRVRGRQAGRQGEVLDKSGPCLWPIYPPSTAHIIRVGCLVLSFTE